MTVYSEEIDTADELIRESGSAAVLTKTTAGTYDPVTQAETGATTTTTTVRVVKLPAGKSAEVVVGSLVGRKVWMVYVAAKDIAVTPAPGDTITIGSTVYSIIGLAELSPDETAIIWTLFVETV